MKLALKLLAAAFGVLAALWLVFAWFEAEQEVRILCGEFHPGMEREHVIHTLETGEFLRYRNESDANDPTIFVDSIYTLGTSRCLIEFQSGRVVSAVYE